MSHVFQVSDEQYAELAVYAAQQKRTPEMLFQEWVNEVTHGVKKSTTFNQTEQEGREEEVLNSPLFQVAGLFAIGEPGWADRHDEYLAQGYLESHANDK
jgi:hypothetical protein